MEKLREVNKKGRKWIIYLCVCGEEFSRRSDYKNFTGFCTPCSDKQGGKKREKHGLSDRLTKCWYAMQQRAKVRGESCNVSKEWLGVSGLKNFREWSKNNGYQPHLQLCRNQDILDYEPDNCRWDTLENNVAESRSKTYEMLGPSGELIKFTNMSKYCRENNHNVSGLRNMLKGKTKAYKGYTRCV